MPTLGNLMPFDLARLGRRTKEAGLCLAGLGTEVSTRIPGSIMSRTRMSVAGVRSTFFWSSFLGS